MAGKVLVTDAQMRSSLAVIRSLGKQDLEVSAGEETRFASSFFSKYCQKHIVYPSPKHDKDKFIKTLLSLVKKNEYDVIFPVADACLKPIIDNRADLSKYTRIALPENDIFINGYDKGRTLKIANENDIPCPKTYFDLESVYRNKDDLDYPIVIKPTVGSGSRGVAICNSFDELIRIYHDLERKHGKLLVQEFIPSGGELGLYTLFNFDSKPRAYTVQERIRSYPISGGPSTLRRTIRNEKSAEAVNIGFKLLKAMKWSGVGMVEFRIDARDGSLKLMEVNPRFWGSLQLSILSGIDFPYLLYRLLMDGDVEPIMDYKEKVYCRWLLPGDILWYLNSPDKLKNFGRFFTWDIPDDIISKEDIGPTFGFILATLRYLFDKEMWNFILRR